MTTASLTMFAVSPAGWVISIIATLIVAVLAWNAFGGKEDMARLRRRSADQDPRDT